MHGPKQRKASKTGRPRCTPARLEPPETTTTVSSWLASSGSSNVGCPSPRLLFFLRRSVLPTFKTDAQPVVDKPPPWEFEYPFEAPPSELATILNDEWHYESQNLRVRAEVVPRTGQHLAMVRCGEQLICDYWADRDGTAPPSNLFPKAVDQAEQLRRVGEVVACNFSDLIEKLTPERMLFEIEDFGAGEYADRHWIAAYRKHLRPSTPH